MIAKYGRKDCFRYAVTAVLFILAICAAASCGFFGWPVAQALSALVAVIFLGICAFFRDPDRKIPDDASLIVSPADGTVRDIELIKSESVECEELRELFCGKDMLRVGIFLSVFNVHVNRAPTDMTVRFTRYKEGAFHDARSGRAVQENESMIVGGIGSFHGTSFPVAVKQISGAVARRIVCPVEKGESFRKGARYGMIKFGSRTELYLPAGCGFDVVVSVGDTVQGGSTILAEINHGAQDKLSRTMRSISLSGGKSDGFVAPM